MKPSIVLSVVLGASLASTPAAAANCTYTGEDHPVLASNFQTVGLTLCSTHFPLGSDAYNAVVWALEQYNNVQGSNVQLVISGLAPHRSYDATLENDGVNRVDINTCTVVDCSYTGRTARFGNIWGNITEFDITMKDTVDWWWDHPYSWDFNGDNFRTNFLHELGHGVGFDHTHATLDAPNIMGSKTGGWLGAKKAGLKAADHGHLRHHYGVSMSLPRPDLVLSNYHTVPTWNPETSQWGHPLEMNDQISGGTLVGNVVEARHGDTITITWTRMNTGPVAVTTGFQTAIYASTNSIISTADTQLKSWTHTNVVDESSTLQEATTRLVIPSTLPAGTYYVGMIIDMANAVPEADEGNNSLLFEKMLRVLP